LTVEPDTADDAFENHRERGETGFDFALSREENSLVTRDNSDLARASMIIRKVNLMQTLMSDVPLRGVSRTNAAIPLALALLGSRERDGKSQRLPTLSD
jgi:hypothetical protein